MIRITSLTFLFALLVTLSGCASWFTGDLQKPVVRLVKVDVVKAKLLEQRFLLHFSVDNPNDSSLSVRSLDYRVTLNDVELADGEANTRFSVPAHGRHEFEIPVRTNLWRHLKGIVRALEKLDQPIRYSFQGSVKTGLLFGSRVHLSRNGEIIPGNYLPE